MYLGGGKQLVDRREYNPLPPSDAVRKQKKIF